MKKIFLIFVIIISVFGCSKNESSQPNTPNNSTFEVENLQRTIASLPTNFFKPKTGGIKGIVILGSGNNPENPTPGDINDGYLINLSQTLAAKGYACAIVQYRDQPYVGVNYENFNSNRDMLVTDFNNVSNALKNEFVLARNKIIFGGSSYSANCLVSHNAWGTGFTDIKGVIAIMGSCALDTAQNQKTPVLAFACNGEPFGTNFGSSLVQSISNTTVKTNSFGLTDNSCNGHNTSNNWVATVGEKVSIWIP